ncbi:hypothetical protein [Spirosoma endophyticum]|nr:hypothetical protein [Spirosoma endophyticum]
MEHTLDVHQVYNPMVAPFNTSTEVLNGAEINKDNYTESGILIPNIVADSERIVRTVYAPIHLKKKVNELRYQAFSSPVDMDEISVTRLEYSNADFCKQSGKENEKPDKRRTYFGLAVLLASEVREVSRSLDMQGDVIYSPIDSNIAHADIKLGFTPIKDQQLTGEQILLMETLADQARLFPDNDMDSNAWTSGELN